jgi:hypothetical protein
MADPLVIGRLGDLTVEVCYHAAARMIEMGMAPHEVHLTLTAPDETYESTKYPGDICYRRGKYALATRTTGDVIVVKTALYGRMSDWRAAEREGRLGDGRELREDTGIPE